MALLPKTCRYSLLSGSSSRAYVLIDKESYTDLPTSVVFKKNGQRTALVYNLSNSDRPVRIYVQGKEVLKAIYPPRFNVPLK